MSRNAYAFLNFFLGGVDIVRRNWGAGIEAGPLNWGGCGPAHPKSGGDPLAAEGRAILGTPPQCVFGTFPNI